MDWSDRRVLLTGGSKGIGRFLARGLRQRGATLILASRTPGRGQDLDGPAVHTIKADLSAPDGWRVVADEAQRLGPVDVLINNAGASWFGHFELQSPEDLERDFRLNALTPMLLTRALLPGMLARGHGQVINVGSTFGSIGFAHFSGYSAAKFALRGFSEALRRELEGRGVDVGYVAPRATRTSQMDEYSDMAREVRMNVDDPEAVAARILGAIERRTPELYIGFPESLFARLNGVLPRVVDLGLRSQNRRAAEFAASPTIQGAPS